MSVLSWANNYIYEAPIIFVLTKWTGSIWNFHVYKTRQRILNTIWRHIVDGWFYEQATFSDIFPPLQKYMNSPCNCVKWKSPFLPWPLLYLFSQQKYSSQLFPYLTEEDPAYLSFWTTHWKWVHQKNYIWTTVWIRNVVNSLNLAVTTASEITFKVM